MLEVRDLHAYYGKSHILRGVDFRVDDGEIVSLLGRNGVGRSTTIKAIMGDVDRTGSVVFKGRELIGLKPHQIARGGLGYVPENRDIFPQLTVRENLILGMKSTKPGGRWSMQDMFDLFPRLHERAETPGGVLSGGEQQMLTICRTLMGDPDLIMIDEPTEGSRRRWSNWWPTCSSALPRVGCRSCCRAEADDRAAHLQTSVRDGAWSHRLRRQRR